jgi:hypothetical protein
MCQHSKGGKGTDEGQPVQETARIGRKVTAGAGRVEAHIGIGKMLRLELAHMDDSVSTDRSALSPA